jgi:hypothetical protein
MPEPSRYRRIILATGPLVKAEEHGGGGLLALSALTRPCKYAIVQNLNHTATYQLPYLDRSRQQHPLQFCHQLSSHRES